MAMHRHSLPQLSGQPFLTDSGLETDLIFHGGFDLPDFAAFTLLDDATGTEALRTYYREHAQLVTAAGQGVVLETPTWRASPDWADRLGYRPEVLAERNSWAVALLADVRAELPQAGPPVVLSGCVGPRGDGYTVSARMSEDAAQAYHAVQVETFAGTDADMVTAMTVAYAEEAVGIVRAARSVDMPVVISFTVETDGTLPDGTALREAIGRVDDATDACPAYYMVNCAHPSHVAPGLQPGADWMTRLRGVRANASQQSHAELDDSDELDDGDPAAFAGDLHALAGRHPGITVLGGCCGTDLRHIAALADATA